jgi:hypothetical protein
MGTLRQGLLKILGVSFLDGWVFVGKTGRGFFIQLIQCKHAIRSKLNTVAYRLSAASDAAAGAGHDLNKIIGCFAFSDLFNYFPGIG